MSLQPPETLNNDHVVTDFSCGIVSLDHWLKQKALANQASGATRTFVVCIDNQVVGYYALASGAIGVKSALGKFRCNMSNPIPVVILARLAIDISHQGQGLGRALFRDAARRVVQAAETMGIRGIIVHTIDDQARDFYLTLGFNVSPLEPLTLMITLNDLRACLI